MTVTAVTSLSQFREIISRDKVSVFYFWAPWCDPCKTIGPVFEGFSNDETYRTVSFYKVNVDDNGTISKEVGIRTMPTFIIFQNGERAEALVGATGTKLKTLLGTAANRK